MALGHVLSGIYVFCHKLFNFHQELDIIIFSWREGDIHHSLCPVSSVRVCVDYTFACSGDRLSITSTSKLSLLERNIAICIKHLILKSKPVSNAVSTISERWFPLIT